MEQHPKSSDSPISPYRQIEQKIACWASRTSEILLVLVYGSRAASNGVYDEFSDLDVIVFTSNPDFLTLRSSWLEEFGQIWLAVLDRTGAEDPEWFVLYRGGYKVDIIVLPHLLAIQAGNVRELPYSQALNLGTRILHKADGEPKD